MDAIINPKPSVTTLKDFWEAKSQGLEPKYIIICRDCKRFQDIAPYLIKGNNKNRKYCEDCI